jgi:phosphonate degradation associated HDIG domain protein
LGRHFYGDPFLAGKQGEMEQQKIATVLDSLFSLYAKYGHSDYIGEPVSQIEHMCQAAQLAMEEGADDETILAAFFHDVGHLCEHIMPVEKMDNVGIVDHESIGQNYLLQLGFSPKIGKLVAGHVQAKRYLTWKHPEYLQKLSPASLETLKHQGGVMTNDEAIAFENDPLFIQHIQMRKWDDQAKQVGLPLTDLEFFKHMALRHLLQQNPNEK